MKGGCTDLRNIGPNSPVRVFSPAGKLVRIEKATTIDDFVGKAVRMPTSRRNEPPYAMLGKWGRQSAFTLVELLIVVCIIGVLAAILIPAVGAWMRQTQTEAMNTLTVMHTPVGDFELSDNVTALISGSTLYVYSGSHTYTFPANWWSEKVKR